jgi:uncharacterized protein
MTTATIAVKGSASDDFPANYAIAHFGYEFVAPARSEALAEANAAIAHLRDTVTDIGAGVREMKVQSFRVEETFNHVGVDHIREHSGWAAHVGGQVLVEASAVPAAVAQLIKTGASTHQLTWHLDRDTQLQAHRAVRREAVADAREAASDFALALGAELGTLITLADPGLHAGPVLTASPRRASAAATAMSGASSASWDEYVDIDPALITISANVEASYEVTLP